MAPTLLNAALGALLAAALLGPAFDWRSVAIVVAAALLPDLDAIASLAMAGATNALVHNVWIPLAVAGLLYWDTALRERYGWRGVRVGWVALAGFAVAGVAPDLFTEPGVSLLYPVENVYYVVDGLLLFSTQDGVVQTFVSASADTPGILPFESPGTTETHAVPTWVNPDGRPGLALGSERRLVLVDAGWQAVVVASAVASLGVRFRPWTRSRTEATPEGSGREASR
ncbi:metal-dependent hydrolase [Halorubrum sp. F4]|uniref:metal-dependent hydrolase n=1 Tax=Halorubrum sp. F4 TaxID=2989715 RepID=UPI00247FF04A|nr:metal-dependent hydrolase [Halorubrum sp. F4]